MFSLWRNVTAAIKLICVLLFLFFYVCLCLCVYVCVSVFVRVKPDGLKLNPERMARVALQMLYNYLNRIAYHKKRIHDYKTLFWRRWNSMISILNNRSSTWFSLQLVSYYSLCVYVFLRVHRRFFLLSLFYYYFFSLSLSLSFFLSISLSLSPSLSLSTISHILTFIDWLEKYLACKKKLATMRKFSFCWNVNYWYSR